MGGEIYAAMAKAMAEIGSIGKTRKNQQQGYEFRGIDDVMAHVQPVLAACGIVVVPEVFERERELIPTKSGGTMASVRLLVRHTFWAKDGSCVAATTLGEAMDSGDKATNKAMSAALKYALTESLMIPTYEADRDTEDASPQMADVQSAVPATAAQMATQLRASIEQKREEHGYDRAMTFGFGKDKGVPVSQLVDSSLDWYAKCFERDLADPSKARFHEKTRTQLHAVDSEIAKRSEAF